STGPPRSAPSAPLDYRRPSANGRDCTLTTPTGQRAGAVVTPTFLTSAAQARDLPPDEGREVAFVGRSNSGKSSALNAILGVRGLARIGKTPGRSQHLHFFAVGPGRRFDLQPGWCFARLDPATSDRW